MKKTAIVVSLIICMVFGGVAGSAVPVSALTLDEGIALGIIGGRVAHDAAGDDLQAGDEESAENDAETMSAAAAEIPLALAKSYEKTEGEFELTQSSRFYIATDRAPADDLLNNVRLIDAEMATMGLPGDEALSVVYGNGSRARQGDIVIFLCDEDNFDAAPGTADVKEAYNLSIGDMAIITACDAKGAYYGLLTMLELVQANEQSAENHDTGAIRIDGCLIQDGPDVKERVLFLDCGRKYFSPEWIKNLIRRASLQRYNRIELHFSEAQALRFDSEVFPWLTEGVDSISREEMADIIQTARTYNLEVIPSVDVPAHNTYTVEKYAEYVSENPDWSFEYGGTLYNAENTRGFGSIANHYSYNGDTKNVNYIGIDVTKEHATAFIDALLADYADFFAAHGCTEFDIGGDEILGWYEFGLGGRSFNYSNRWDALEHWATYAQDELGIENGSASDTFINYLNGVASKLGEKGFTCRAFNDEINLNDNQHIKLDESIQLSYWDASVASAQSYADEGHSLINDVSTWNYYVVLEQGGADVMSGKYKHVNGSNIWLNWNPKSFSSKQEGEAKTIDDEHYLGACFHVWCDTPDYKTAAEIWDELDMKAWANASKMWNCEASGDKNAIGKSISYDDFRTFAKSFNGFPGFTGDADEEAQLAPASPLVHMSGRLLSRLFDL